MKQIKLNITRRALCALASAFLILVISGCGSRSEDRPSYAYLGGEIVNPTTNYIVLKHKSGLKDTVYLDERNRFEYTLEDPQKGLYILNYKPETQNIFIAPGDSLLFRVNTLAFDESLHFSGRGNEKNNFLTDMFLKDENNASLLLDFHEYPPHVFLQKADSIKAERLQNLQKVAQKRNFPEDFVKLAEEIIKSENNDLKERYTYLVNKYYKQYAKQIPEGFHDYRKEIDFNSESLQCNAGYRRLLENYLINYSLSWCATSGLDNADCYSTTEVNNVISRLRKAGELIEVPALKKYLLEKIAVRGIVMAKSREDIVSILQELESLGVAPTDLEKMRQLGAIQTAYLPGTVLSNVPLVNMDGELLDMEEAIEKPTVIFLWSVYDEGHQEEHQFIENYRKKYPEVDFIGLNLDVGEEPAWRVAVRENNYNRKYEYQLGATRIEQDYFRYFLDKILLINSSAEVVVGDTYLTSPEFESHILALLNQ